MIMESGRSPSFELSCVAEIEHVEPRQDRARLTLLHRSHVGRASPGIPGCDHCHRRGAHCAVRVRERGRPESELRLDALVAANDLVTQCITGKASDVRVRSRMRADLDALRAEAAE